MARQLSTNMDIESLRYPSWCLSRLLDILIGTKEQVALRRSCDSMSYYVVRVNTSYNMLHSGSNGEGFDLPSSDIDVMFIDRNTVIQENIHGTQSVDKSKTVLLMGRDGCNPGFVTLELLGTANDDEINESVVEYRGVPVVSSFLYRDLHNVQEYGDVGNGPCNTFKYPYGKECDCAFCFEYDQWPTEANEFIYRQRLHGWPEKSLLDKIVCRGCHLVAIGDKNTDISHIQWRLSFSAAEKDLVHSFNHTQFLVYGLLKMFLKQFINKFQLLDGILCSYFLKTAMFYSIESTPSYLWRDDLLIPCFWFCINKLITWVDQGYCPNYFVPQNNMFRNKVFGQHRHNLLCTLNQCIRTGWTCLYLCEDLKALQTVVSHPECSSGLIPSEKEYQRSLDMIAANWLLINRLTAIDEETMLRILARSLALFSRYRTQQEKDYSTLLLYTVLVNIGRSEFCIGGSSNNKDNYKTLRKCKRLFEMVSEDIGYFRLHFMSTFYYKTGQYLKAIHALERVISTWKPYVMYFSFINSMWYHSDLYQRYVCGTCSKLTDRVRSAFVGDVSIYKRIEPFYPAELCHDIQAVSPFELRIPPLPYSMFLLFLCHHKLGNIDRSFSVLHDLIVLACDGIQGGRQHPVVLNMVAICLDKLGDKHGAVDMCLLSQDLKADKNAADKLLDKILSTLYQN